MITGFEHVAIFVRYIEKTVQFYQENLGAEVIREAHIPSSDTKIAYLQIGQGIIEALCPKDQSVVGFNHIAFRVEDLDGVYEQFSQAEIPFSVRPKVAGSGVGRIAFLSDPDNIRVELIAQPEFRKPLAELSQREGILGIDHYSLRVSDIKSSQQFYENFFQTKFVKRAEIPEKKLTLVYLESRYDMIELVESETTRAEQGIHIGHIAIRVKNVEQETARLQAQGVAFEVLPRVAAVGEGKVAVFSDPDGNRIEILDREDLREL